MYVREGVTECRETCADEREHSVSGVGTYDSAPWRVSLCGDVWLCVTRTTCLAGSLCDGASMRLWCGVGVPVVGVPDCNHDCECLWVSVDGSIGVTVSVKLSRSVWAVSPRTGSPC